MNADRFKFRVWDKYAHETPAEQIQFLCFNGCLVDSDGCHHSPDDYIFEQCTGLRDINGNLIYEGDIVRFVKQRGYYTQKGAIYTIEFGVFRFCGFGWRNCPEHDVEFALTESAAKKCEIIGNIHEQKDVE